MPLHQPKRVAIIGGGSSGISAFWALQHSTHDVHLFEASSTLGGRIKSVPFEHNGHRVDVDTESLSFNTETCPNLASLLCHLRVETSEVPFCFGASDCTGSFSWHESILKDIIQQPWILFSLETYRTLMDIIWLKYMAIDVLADCSRFSKTKNTQRVCNTHAYLADEGYSSGFTDKYLTPLLSMLWKTNASRLLPQLPVDAMLNCLYDHRLLYPRQARPQWRRIDTKATEFVQAMTQGFPPEKVHLNTRVRGIRQFNGKQYSLLGADDQEMVFDHVILAVDGHEILNILGRCLDIEETSIIQDLATSRNIAILHSDPILNLSCNPQWPASNYTTDPHSRYGHQCAVSSHPTLPKSCLTYNVNMLQDLPTYLFGRVFITLNPFTPPHPGLVQGIWEFTDAEPSVTSLYAQQCLPSIQNERGLSYCYSWTGRGNLEDAITASFEIAIEHLGARVPFSVDYHGTPANSAPLVVSLGLRGNLIRIALRLLRLYALLLGLLFVFLRVVWGKTVSVAYYFGLMLPVIRSKKQT
ncbi:uncharacterized protein BDW47DRAFT_30168 [Aspergillus candidus]|uniref:FAD/NAD(P)-binding domain-containing protein n=1 Tax=Aspergillus candidus TaxID=41067 RepID=A0A2I2FC97_ASPCN|nr:FAD/NAD(P)-binding domain-containing protein [Aspergillus candidus]PLB38250.1 FAD/NAD(P)-binding domain-containing protein [Aspergillus candidus]